MTPRVLALGDTALTLELGEGIDSATSDRVMAARDALIDRVGITDVVPAYRSLTVHFDPLRRDAAELGTTLLRIAENLPQESALATRHGVRHELPVCFGGENGPDLDAVATATGRPAEEIVATLCGIDLRVYMIGFLPGFPYLGDLPEWLALPRRPTPRTAVPANSVAIAGRQAAVYPWQSPGGWHLLGRTPMSLFDAADPARPALLAPGDTVRFVAIDHA